MNFSYTRIYRQITVQVSCIHYRPNAYKALRMCALSLLAVYSGDCGLLHGPAAFDCNCATPVVDR